MTRSRGDGPVTSPACAGVCGQTAAWSPVRIGGGRGARVEVRWSGCLCPRITMIRRVDPRAKARPAWHSWAGQTPSPALCWGFAGQEARMLRPCASAWVREPGSDLGSVASTSSTGRRRPEAEQRSLPNRSPRTRRWPRERADPCPGAGCSLGSRGWARGQVKGGVRVRLLLVRAGRAPADHLVPGRSALVPAHAQSVRCGGCPGAAGEGDQGNRGEEDGEGGVAGGEGGDGGDSGDEEGASGVAEFAAEFC